MQRSVVIGLVAAFLLAPLAQADDLTGDRLASTDADGDAYADGSESLVGADPGSADATPLGVAVAALRASLLDGELAVAGTIRTGWASSNASHEAGAEAFEGALTDAGGATALAFEAARAALAEAAAKAREPLSPDDQSTLDALAAAADATLAQGASGVTGALASGGDVAGAGAGSARAISDMGFAFGLDRSIEVFTFARMRATTARVTADAVAGASAQFLYESEVASGTIGDEDGSSIPLQGIFIDLDRNGARAGDGAEDVSITDVDRDGFSNRLEVLLGTDPRDARSVPHDVDRDRWPTEDEIFSAGTIENAVLGPLDPRRTPIDVDGDGFLNTEEDRDVDGIVDAPYETDPEDPASHPRPTAAFAYAPAEPSALDDVSFSDLSTYDEPIAPPGGHIVSWSWDFGDGTTSDEREPVHRFPDDGAYTVSLTVTEDHGAIATHEIVLEVVNLAPVAAFAVVSTPTLADPDVGLDASASADADGDVVSWRWDFADGTPPTTRATPTIDHFFAAPGTYQVALTVTDDDGAQTTLVQPVVVANVAPAASFVHTGAPARAGFATSFTDTSVDPLAGIVSWAWDFGDGATSAARHPTHTYASAGWRTVTLTVADSVGATGVASLAIFVHGPPQVDFATGSPLDDVTPVAFTDLTVAGTASLVSWAWDFGDGATSTQRHPTHLYDDDGVYSVTLVVTDAAGITGTRTRSVTILNVGPEASFAAPAGELLTLTPIAFHADVSDVDGAVTSVRWDFGDGTTSTALDPMHTYASDPTTDERVFVVTLVATDDDGAQSAVFSRVLRVLQDTDGDGTPDVRDLDADGDGFSNADETSAGSHPRDAASTPTDFDGDGVPNLADRTAGSLSGHPNAERDPCAPVACG